MLHYQAMKTIITNRHQLHVMTVVEGPEIPGKLAIVMHGLSGNKHGLNVRAIAEAFLEQGYTVVTFDTTHTSGGESDGLLEDATLTGYYQDLEDVINWASNQPWFVKPFVLAGHSFGGICTSLYAQAHPEAIKGLAPISSVVSGELSLDTPKSDPKRNHLEQWQRDGGWTFMEDGRQKRFKWALMEDRLKYSVLPEAGRLTMPVLLVVGSADEPTPPEHEQIFFDALPGPKELHIIDGAAHTFRRPEERAKLKHLIKDWVSSL